ncbi:MAG TPA: class II D-tagatose-bisphosphate aldolase, non-catalytic subunit, partial [Acidobacteriota bacterium]|nr:class II D-tagatose-bisphosphate aldolase, non-catalytic subunit [Acidobacteriota bacterium]
GPYPWRQEPAALAMQKAEDLVRSYVEAGFCKIHLDASMRCADDAGDPKTPLNETIVMERTAALARVAEEAASRRGSDVRPVYVVGTEVPVPGGEKTRSQAPEVTSAEDVRSTLEQTKATLERRGLGHVWERVIALVVQPGVEYSDDAVFEYDRCKTANLSALIREAGTCVYEAHSTDYQKPEALSQLVKDHFAILKVGPWLTFAFREAVFALSMIEEEWLGDRRSVELSRVREALESVMVKDPADWQGYYTGDEAYLRYARRYSFSDRCRYYWPRPEVQAALSRLVSNLKNYPPPLTLISQFLPVQYEGVRAGVLSADPTALICDKIAGVLRLYSKACRLGLFGRESAG